MHFNKGIAAVVITYHPPADLLDNISSYASWVHQVYVYDNSEPAADLRFLSSVKNVQVIRNGENKGIAANLNQAAHKAISEGYQWLLTMDQDSRFETAMLTAYLQCVQDHAQKESVALFGPNYEQQKKSIACTPVVVTNLITSGALLNLKHFNRIGAFDENLFIDSVDFDYSIRARLQGLQLIRFDNIFLQHNLGTPVHRSSIKSAFLKKKTKRVHNPVRCYYMYRNMLYLSKKLKQVAPVDVADLRSTVTGNLKANFFYGRFAVPMLRYLWKAHKDFAAGRMGRIMED